LESISRPPCTYPSYCPKIEKAVIFIYYALWASSCFSTIAFQLARPQRLDFCLVVSLVPPTGRFTHAKNMCVSEFSANVYLSFRTCSLLYIRFEFFSHAFDVPCQRCAALLSCLTYIRFPPVEVGQALRLLAASFR